MDRTTRVCIGNAAPRQSNKRGLEAAEGSVWEDVFGGDFHDDGSVVDWNGWFVVDVIIGKALLLDCVEMLLASLA